MGIPEDSLQEILLGKDTDAALERCNRFGYSEGWAIRDGAIVIYNCDTPPRWMPAAEED